MKKTAAFAIALAGLLATSAAPPPRHTATGYSVIIRGGTIYDGSGGAPYVGDVALKGDKIVYVGPHAPGRAARIVDATGKAVSPGFVNMLSWATESLIADGRGLSDTAQGVTLEVMGEGNSMGPWNAEMKRLAIKRQGDIKYPIRWTTLGAISRISAEEGHHAQRRLLRRRDDGARARARREGRRSDAGAAHAHARAGTAGDEGRRDGRRLVADLRAGDLCRDARADRPHDRGGEMRRNVHQPHAVRGEQARSKRSTSWSRSASNRALRRKSITSSRQASRTGARSTPRSPK